MSSDVVPAMPLEAAAILPASPWMYTAATAAYSGGIFCAISPAISPVSTSPEPAVASASVPEEFTSTEPSGHTVWV